MALYTQYILTERFIYRYNYLKVTNYNKYTRKEVKNKMAIKLGRDALAKGILAYLKEPGEGEERVNISDVCAEAYAWAHLTDGNIPKNFDMDFAKNKSFQAAGFLESKLKDLEGANPDLILRDLSSIYGNALQFMGFY